MVHDLLTRSFALKNLGNTGWSDDLHLNSAGGAIGRYISLFFLVFKFRSCYRYISCNIDIPSMKNSIIDRYDVLPVSISPLEVLLMN